ncbi:MAG: hypothetical protein U0289_06780 [Cyclobacteriaceae bacterium]|jgi:hypothetical protein|nr:hypothetical protein [Cytophagales bacterium]HNP76877.1 hypothetical protein [Cyclobacteriaceae bacterium]
MTEEAIRRIGLEPGDLDQAITSKSEVIEAVLASARLFRKVLHQVIYRELKIHLNNPKLNLSDELVPYFPFRHRTRSWGKFRNVMPYDVPGLQLSWLAKIIMITYVIVFVYMSFRLSHGPAHLMMMIPKPLGGALLVVELLFPLGIMYEFGQTSLPARRVEELIDKIIQENMLDFLTSNKEKMRVLLEKELTE